MSSMSFFWMTSSTAFSPLSVSVCSSSACKQAASQRAVFQVDDALVVRLADDAVGVEDVGEQVLDVAGGAVEGGADVVPLAVELVALAQFFSKTSLPLGDVAGLLRSAGRASCR